MAENPLRLIMNPQSIAFVGASNNPMKMGTMQALSIIKNGYSGKFYPIHLKEETVLGHRAYTSAHDLPEAPDLVIVAIPTKNVIPLLDEFGSIGTRRAIIITAGFKEAGDTGRELEKSLIETVNRHSMRFVGPNCVGIINSRINLNTTILGMDKLPGRLGLASQSGTYVTQTLHYLKQKGIRLSKAISLGNEANIDIVTAMEYLAEDDDTKAIILYIEGIRDGRRFVDAARSITPFKPVLAQYVGGSAAGARAGMSHTGAMAGPDFLYDGIFRQTGIIRVGSVEELYAQGWALATQPTLRGRRVGVLTNSGGPATAISYACDSAGMDVPRFSSKLQEEIKKHIQSHAAAGNPVDMTFDLDMPLLSVTIPEIIMKSGEVDALVLHGAMGRGFMKEAYDHAHELVGDVPFEEFFKTFDRDLSGAYSLPQKYNMPLLVSSFFDREDNYTKAYQDNNVPVYDSPERAARALISLYQYSLIKKRKTAVSPALPPVNETAANIVREARARGQKALDEYEAKKLLAAYGIPVVREMPAATEPAALAAAKELGYPVALKACSWEIIHKSGKGLIALNVENEEMLKKEFKNIQQAAGKAVPVLVQKMIAGSREFLAGMTRFAGFGPCVVFGLGGIFTEALRDTTIRLAPLALAEAQEMITDIRAQKLLGEFRGMPMVNTDALAFILQAIGFIALAHPEIAEIDLNPIIIEEDKPVVADALIVLDS